MTSSIEKWPVEIKIVKVSSSVLFNELTLYFFTGVMNRNQADTLKERLSILSEFELETDRIVLTSLVNQSQLESAYTEFSRLSKEFRGQYYAITNRFVDAYNSIIDITI